MTPSSFSVTLYGRRFSNRVQSCTNQRYFDFSLPTDIFPIFYLNSVD